MTTPFTATGGARIGWANATWPFAKLTVTHNSLLIDVQVLGEFAFTPDTVVAITSYTTIPVLGWGIQIHHCVPDYPGRVIFWHRSNPDALLASIETAGFKPQAPASAMPVPLGLPLRWPAIAVAIVVWLGLIIPEVLKFQTFLLTKRPPLPGPDAVIAVGLFLAATFATLRFPAFQRLILKPGRNISLKT